MRYLTVSVHVASFLPTFLASRNTAFLLPAAAGAVMTGASAPQPPAAATPAATRPATAAAAVSGIGPATDAGSGGGSSPSHLVVLSHGLVGTPEDLNYLKESLERAGGSEILVHSARRNEGKTKDGVAEGGSRLAEEILEVVSSTPSLSRISLVGNSLGGLYVRYAAKLLYRDDDDNDDARGARAGVGCRATVAGLKPSVFMTIACPHLGVRRFTYVPLPSKLHPLAKVFVGKTGSDLFLAKIPAAAAASDSEDNPEVTQDGDTGTGGGSGGGGAGGGRDDGGKARDGREPADPPLLYDMATSEDFLQPLKAFRWRRAYANRRGDFMVPYGTAAFLETDEEDGSEEAPAAAAGVPCGTESFTVADRLLGAKSGAIVGVSRVPSASAAATPGAPAAAGSSSGREERLPKDGLRTGVSARIRASSNKRAAAAAAAAAGEVRSMEEEMAAGLNSCGWEKVSVDFGGLAPFSHNKICALSRSPLTSALFGCGKSIVDHAADFLVTHDQRGVDGDDGDDDDNKGCVDG